MSTSLEESEILPALQKLVRAEVERLKEGASATEGVMKPAGKKRATEQLMKPRKKRAKKRVMEQVMKRAMEQVMEPMIKRVIKRETKGVIKREMKHLFKTLSPQGAPTDWNVIARPSLHHQITISEVREYHLRFFNKLHDIIYTKDNITDEDGKSVQIQLIDPKSGGIIEKIGDLSSIEIEIVVLKDDFGSESHENWTEQAFNDKIVSLRGNKPLVKGKQEIRLRNGVGTIDDLSFSYNSNRSWTECGKFRLGARVLQSSSDMGQVRIREAITEAFTVRDQRGKMQHLEKIKEGGKFHKALIENNIRLGSDLKLMYETDPDKLKMILGCSKWGLEVIGHHGPRVLDDANSIPSRSQEAEANDTTTTCGPPFGSTGMQRDSNRASSSQYQAENFEYSASQPPDMSITHSLVNAQFIPSNDSHQPHSTVRYSPDDNLRTESFQNNSNGLYGQQNSDGVPFDPDNYFDWTN